MTRIELRRGTANEWAAVDPILAAGEPAFETDTGKFKVGDGTAPWSQLPVFLTDVGPNAAYVRQAPGAAMTTDSVAAYRIDNTTSKRGLQVTQSGANYALNVVSSCNTANAVNINQQAGDGAYTVFGLSGSNTDLSTVKVTNNAAQVGGAVIAALGTNASRTAAVINADNYGGGPALVAAQKPGVTGVGLKVAYDSAATYNTNAIWVDGRHTGGTIVNIANASPQTSGSMLALTMSDAGSSATLLKLTNSGTGYFMEAGTGFAVDNSGAVRTTQMVNITSFNNARVIVGMTGTKITRNVADGSTVLQVRQDDPTATGDLLSVQTSGSAVKARINKTGHFITAVTAAPADADLSAGEAALWFDSTNGAAKLMVKARQADGTVRTGSVALA